MKIFSNRNKNK